MKSPIVASYEKIPRSTIRKLCDLRKQRPGAYNRPLTQNATHCHMLNCPNGQSRKRSIFGTRRRKS